MEKRSVTRTSKFKAALLIVAVISALFFLVCTILHLTPENLAESVFDFATHHYFLMAFISSIVFVICLKVYFGLSSQIEHNNRFRKTSAKMAIKKAKADKLMELQRIESEAVDKDTIKVLTFPKEEVLTKETEKLNRMDQLNLAMKLGNMLKHKVRIFFKDASGLRHVETTVWYASNSHVSLKGGVTIPVQRIIKVEV